MSRIAFASALVVLAGVLHATPTEAQSTQSRLDRARREATSIQSQIERIADAFAHADAAQDRTESQIGRTSEEIRRVKADLGELQHQLKDRVRTAYRMRGVGFFQFLLEAENFSDFNLRLMSLQRQTLADEDLILKLRKKRAELDLKEAELAAQKRVLDQRVDDYSAQGRRMSITLQQANSLVARLRRQLSQEQVAKLFTIRASGGGGGGGGGRSIGLAACPVGHPRAVTNSFGAPRGGGSRRHQGNDIMSPHGTSIHAVNSGTITRTGSGGLGGLSIYLWDGANEYYYAHLSRIGVSQGQKVSGGQVIGANGSTGNASGGAPHLHFEIHPGGGGAIDPYPSLSAVC